MKAIAGALGFFSTIPVGRDAESFESLRENLWILPIVGAILGIFMAIPILILIRFVKNLAFLAVLIYLAVEGINHIDGLADFGDALFAPKDRKLKALKDLKTGVGGTVAVCIYIFSLMQTFSILHPDEIVLAVIYSQMMAKFGMLLLLTTTKPIWEGMASCMMEFARRSDLVVGLTIVIVFTLACLTIYPKIVWVNVAVILLCLLYRLYVIRTFGGVNGDIVGALNCLAFAFSLILFCHP